MSILNPTKYAIGAALLALCLIGCGGPSASSVSVESRTDSLSYAIGMDLGESFNDIGLELSSEALYKGLSDAIGADGEPLFTKEEKEELLAMLNEEARKAQQAKQEEAAEENKKKGEEFLAENGARPEVTTTASGLQYEVIQEGSGPTPQETDEVTVHYTGKLLNGEVFDSSVERGQPASFPLNRVIAGWTEGLQLMNVGSKYKFYIPSQLAYGEMGSPPRIGPGETLVFDVELLEIKAPEATE